MVNSRLNNTQKHFCGIREMSLRGCVEERRENYAFCTSLSRADQIPTHAKLLNIKYEFYGFSGDIIDH